MRNRVSGRFFASVAALSLVAACSGTTKTDADGDGAISAEEIADASADAVKPEAGKYRSVTTAAEIDIPGAPPQAIEAMKAGMTGQTNEYCLTQEEVDKGFEQMAMGAQDGDCEFSQFDVDGGSINAKMSCNTVDENTMTMTMVGEATKTSMEMNMTMEGELPGMGATKMVIDVSHERIGECE